MKTSTKIKILLPLSIIGYAGFPTAIAVISTLNMAPISALSHVPEHVMKLTNVAYSVLLGFSTIIIIGNLLALSHLRTKAKIANGDNRFTGFLLCIFGIGAAVSGVSISAFMLNTLYYIQRHDTVINPFATVIQNESTYLYRLIESETALIVGTVICSLAVTAFTILAFRELFIDRE